MLNSRTFLLTGLAMVVAAVLVWKWVSGWGYVTVDVHDAPLAKVVKSIERQGGVKISTNADPATPVTMLVDRVRAHEAVEALALAIDADARLAYVAAQNGTQIKNVLAAFSSGNNPGGWVVLSAFGGRGGGGPQGGPQREGDGQNPRRNRAGGENAAAQGDQPAPQTAQTGDQPRGERRGGGEARGGGNRPGGGMGGGNFAGVGMLAGDGAIDPRSIIWKPSDMPEKTLKAFFDQGAQKTGVVFALPESWNPPITKLPKAGRAGDVAVQLAKNAQGSVQEVFLLTVQPPRPQQAAAANGEEGSGRWEFSRTVFSPQRGGQRNPEWAAERTQAQLAALPEAQQAEVRKQMDEMRAFWESVRNLPEEERRAKIEEMMNRPDVQEKMEERMSSRDAKTPPQKREDRMRRYLERKSQMKNQPQKS
jgi:hypothetical protein